MPRSAGRRAAGRRHLLSRCQLRGAARGIGGVSRSRCLAPSWPLGAHGVALLQAWTQPAAQAWLTESLHTLRRWKTMQLDMLGKHGWTCLPSETNFFCATPAGAQDLAPGLERLRGLGIKLRDAASFGLSGHVRLSVQPPVAQDALALALNGW